MSWYNEPRRHALSAKGVKTAIDNPMDRGMRVSRADNLVYYKGEYWDIVNFEDGAYTLDNRKGKTAYARPEEIGKENESPKDKVYEIEFIEDSENPWDVGVTWVKARNSAEARRNARNDFKKTAKEMGIKGKLPHITSAKRISKLDDEATEKYEQKKRSSPPIPDTPSRPEAPPYGYDDWEQFYREYGHEVDEHGD